MFKISSIKKPIGIIGVGLLSIALGFAVAALPLIVAMTLIGILVFILMAFLPNNINLKNQRWPGFILVFYILAYSVWPQYSAYKIPGLPAIEPQRLFFALTLITALYLISTGSEIRRGLSICLQSNWLTFLALTLYGLLTIVIALSSETKIQSTFFALRDLALVFAILPATLVILQTSVSRDRVIETLLIGGVIVSILGIIESFVQRNLFSGWLPMSDGYGQWATLERVRDGSYRIQSIFDNPLLLVDYLVCIFPIAAYKAFTNQSFSRKILGIVSALLIIFALYRTGSRAAMLLVFLEVSMLLFLNLIKDIQAKRASKLTYFLGSVFLLSTLLLPFLFSQLSQIYSGRSADEAMSTSARVAMVTRAWDDIAAGNVLGHGAGKAAEVIGIKTGPPGGWIYVLDNYFLTVLLDNGVMGLFLFSVFLAGLLYAANQSVFRTKSRSSVEPYLFASMIGFLTFKLVSSQNQVFPIFFIISALVLVAKVQREEHV